ncbi:MAG: helix-turn-helix transcriptional regulator [Pseudomonadota bacterium]
MRAIELLTPDEVCRELGVRCRVLRLARNLSQAEMAAMTGSSLSSIRRLEAYGQGTLALLVRVVQALQAGAQLESFLIQPTLSIADIERTVAATQRQRAGGPRKRGAAG